MKETNPKTRIFNIFEESYNEVIEELDPQTRAAWESATPKQIALAFIMVIINPINWISFIFHMIKGFVLGIVKAFTK